MAADVTIITSGVLRYRVGGKREALVIQAKQLVGIFSRERIVRQRDHVGGAKFVSGGVLMESGGSGSGGSVRRPNSN